MAFGGEGIENRQTHPGCSTHPCGTRPNSPHPLQVEEINTRLKHTHRHFFFFFLMYSFLASDDKQQWTFCRRGTHLAAFSPLQKHQKQSNAIMITLFLTFSIYFDQIPFRNNTLSSRFNKSNSYDVIKDSAVILSASWSPEWLKLCKSNHTGADYLGGWSWCFFCTKWKWKDRVVRLKELDTFSLTLWRHPYPSTCHFLLNTPSSRRALKRLTITYSVFLFRPEREKMEAKKSKVEDTGDDE